MKKVVLFSIGTILSLVSLTAQLEVNTDGTVVVGTATYAPTTCDFAVLNTSGTNPRAYCAFRMDDVNNYLRLSRYGTSYRNEIMYYTNGVNKWSIGLNDYNDEPGGGGSNYLFIGENPGGSDPYMWFGDDQIGMFTSTPDYSYELTLAGDALAYGGQWTASDIGLKQNVNTIESALRKIQNIRGVTYEYNSVLDSLVGFHEKDNSSEIYTDSTGAVLSQNEERTRNPFSTTKYGVVAQELKEEFPELTHEGSSGYLAVNYTGLIPVLIEAIKEQQTLIEDMQSEIDNINGVKKSLLIAGSEDSQINVDCVLYQNAPNPFSIATTINYFLPEDSGNASIMICDMNGKQIRSLPLNTFGESSIEIAGRELTPGMYMYAMIVDNQLVDTKQMIVTE